MGCGGEAYIGVSGQKSYETTNTVPVVVIDEENEKAPKHGTLRFITNFLDGSIKNKKIERLLYTYDIPVIRV